MTPHPSAPNPTPGQAVAVFLAFLRLGLTSFGGPVAHLGYFRTEFVERRRWLDDRAYGDLVALCQFLPGPTSSQVGMGIGLQRAGWLGALLAWIGFTLPSALALMAFAYGLARHRAIVDSGAVHGLKVIAVAVVAQAVWGMGRALCPDLPRLALALGAALLSRLLPDAWGQVGTIVACAVVGRVLLQAPADTAAPSTGFGVRRSTAIAALALFAALAIGLPLLAAWSGTTTSAQIAGVYRAGALVFGGGHVVLPLLETAFGDALAPADFLAGYGATQAVPGPLFSFAAYLGAAVASPLAPWVNGLVFLVAVFLPGALLLVGALPFWEALRHRDGVRSALSGVKAGVVGLLLSALVDPVATHAIRSPVDAALALAAFGLLVVARVSPVAVVALGAVAGAVLL